jgi:DNA adenine methylase
MSAKFGRKGKLVFFPYVGGKFYMLDTILKLIPKHEVYVEVFGGSAKVLLNKPPSRIEIYNDYDKRIANLFYVVVFKFEEFYEKVSKLLFSRAIGEQFLEDYHNTKLEKLGDVDLAVKTYYLLRTNFSGQITSTYSFRLSFGNDKNIAKTFFNTLLELEQIHNRLKNVIIESVDFRNLLIRIIHRENVFIYLDPPYYNVKNYYNLNFTKQDHKDLLDLLKQSKAKWLLSGYANPLYDEELKDFYKIEVPAVKHSYGITMNTQAKEKPKVIEVLWANYDITKQDAKLWKNL